MPDRYEDRYFTVRDGLTLHFRDYPGGSGGPPLLCLHGLTRNARDFAHLAERHSPAFRVIILEFRGRGLSERDPQPTRYTPLIYAGDVIALLDELKIPEAIFVGTSLGGLVTMAVAGSQPERIAAAILNDVGPEFGQEGLDRILTYLGSDTRFATWDEAADAIATHQAPSFPNYTRDDWLTMARRVCREHDGEIRFDYDMAIAEPLRAAVGAATPAVDLWPLFRTLGERPLLVVRGTISAFLSQDTAERMMREAPSAQFVFVPDTGHAPELSEPEAAAAIDRFLASLPAG